jgi:DNA-binding response OmpR family regulator
MPGEGRRTPNDLDGGRDMGYTPTLDGFDAIEPALSHPASAVESSVRVARTTLRFGGLSMDSATGAVTYLGHAINLPVQERELLGTLLRRAGQIVSCERLAVTINVTTSTVDKHMASLKENLKRGGASTYPREVSGIGYVLWRC